MIIRSLGLAMLVVLTGQIAYAEDDTRNLSALMAVSGTCAELLVASEARPCGGTLINTIYSDGRVGFYFVVDDSEKSAVSFSGQGEQRKMPSEDIWIQSIDGLVLSTGATAATGECRFGNPFEGATRIECSAVSEAGDVFVGEFLTDGSEPDIVDMSGGSD